jgi:hypothetical protein
MSPRDGSEKQRFSAKMRTARNDLYVSEQDYRRCFLAQKECKPLGRAPARAQALQRLRADSPQDRVFTSPEFMLYGSQLKPGVRTCN